MPNKYQHLTLEERTLIQMQLQQGFKPSAIAASLNRSRSCICRELARNGWKAPRAVRPAGRPPIAGGYTSGRAHLRARKPNADFFPTPGAAACRHRTQRVRPAKAVPSWGF